MNNKIIRVRSQDSKAEKILIKSAKKTITDSKAVLSNLHLMDNDTRKKLVLNIAQLTKSYSVALNKRSLQLLQSTLSISALKHDISCIEISHIVYTKKIPKYKIFKHAFSYFKYSLNLFVTNYRIKLMQKDIDFVNSEIAVYTEVLDVCKEYARRLQFYLSFE